MSNPALFNEDEELQLKDTQSLRLRIVNELTKDGIPATKDDRNFLLETMKDIDKSVYTRTRIKVSNKAVDEQKDSNKIIAELLKRHTVGAELGSGIIPILETKHQVSDVVEGETMIGLETLTYDSFTQG